MLAVLLHRGVALGQFEERDQVGMVHVPVGVVFQGMKYSPGVLTRPRPVLQDGAFTVLMRYSSFCAASPAGEGGKSLEGRVFVSHL